VLVPELPLTIIIGSPLSTLGDFVTHAATPPRMISVLQL
jgi:hypothetical protein